jgi:hypothetical protein
MMQHNWKWERLNFLHAANLEPCGKRHHAATNKLGRSRIRQFLMYSAFFSMFPFRLKNAGVLACCVDPTKLIFPFGEYGPTGEETKERAPVSLSDVDRR